MLETITKMLMDVNAIRTVYGKTEDTEALYQSLWVFYNQISDKIAYQKALIRVAELEGRC